MISILVRIINIARMKLLVLPKANKLDHFACKIDLLTCNYANGLGSERKKKEVLRFC